MKDIYCKIADWIVSQNIDRSVNSTDIKEIADYVFNTHLKSTGVLKVKECLREKGITVKDSKFKDALRVKQFRIVEVDKKTKEVIAVHPWKDLTNLISSNILIIENERNRYRNLSNYPGEIFYNVEYQWKDGTPIRDSKFKDYKPTLWGAKAYDVEKECWRGFCKYIDTESGKEASKILENEVPFPYSRYVFLGSYNKLPEHFIRLDYSNIKDSKLTRKQKIWYGEELENLIYPQYLRRNYQKRKTRRRKK